MHPRQIKDRFGWVLNHEMHLLWEQTYQISVSEASLYANLPTNNFQTSTPNQGYQK